MTATESPVVIVGGGMAGHRLAQQLARHGRHRVVLVGEEAGPAYNRVLLAEVLAGRYAPELAALAALPTGVERRTGRVVRIDRELRRAHCADGSVLRYGELVLATGSNPVLPPLRGLFDEARPSELPTGVSAFRTMADCAAIDALLPGVRQAVVVGGGLLGVSAARALAGRGVPVVLAHQGEHLMERQLDAEGAGLLRRHLEELGVEVHTECRVKAVLTDGDRVTGVELADGYRLEAQLLVVAVGVRPRTALAAEAGLAVRTGVVVDDGLGTGDPHVHAVGDCAEHRGTVYGLAGPALEQADVLARRLAGLPATYPGSRLLTRLTLGGAEPLDLAAFGVTGPAGPGDRVVRLADAARRSYRKVIVRRDEAGGERLVGGVLLGDLTTLGTVADTWQGDLDLPHHPLHLITTAATTSAARTTTATTTSPARTTAATTTAAVTRTTATTPGGTR